MCFVDEAEISGVISEQMRVNKRSGSFPPSFPPSSFKLMHSSPPYYSLSSPLTVLGRHGASQLVIFHPFPFLIVSPLYGCISVSPFYPLFFSSDPQIEFLSLAVKPHNNVYSRRVKLLKLIHPPSFLLLYDIKKM